MPDSTRTLCLDNGLQLTLRHAPRLKRAAAALRVNAGSHDAPAQWPGLAHFLEHLFFLGTARFPLEDGLMRYVQGLGGQVNASTRERTTDYFFEVPPAALVAGLERLTEMLARPDLSLPRQRREREVIHAEFIAWSRNAEAQQQFALLQQVSPRHPLSGFHAGNRYTLALGDSAFQQALSGFHQRFYQGAQITLSLAGPQPLDELEGLGRQFGGVFAQGPNVTREPPPPLLDAALSTPWLFAHDNLPPGAEPALGLLLSHLRDTRAGTWLGALRERGWLRTCSAQVLHGYAGQLLWQLKLQLAEQAPVAEAEKLLHGWLGFLRQQDLQQLNQRYAHLQQRRELAANALELAQRDSAGLPFAKLDAQGLAALQALLRDLPHANFGHWQLPAEEPLLQSAPIAHSAPLPPGFAISESLPASREFAAVYLRWRITSAAREHCLPVLQRALQPLQARAEHASLQLGLSAAGEHWQLRVAGQPWSAIRLLGEALALLRNPPAEHWHAEPATEPALIPLRALLKALPDALQPAENQPQPGGQLGQPMLTDLWQQACWQGLASGLGQQQLGALGWALQGLMGQPGEPAPPLALQGRRWVHVPTEGREPALLLFCPLPTELQAPGRLLAHLLQGRVYQRLRVELQLGYAVFSAFRQVDGHAGLLFGVQSPHASPAQILSHLLQLLGEGIQLDAHARQQLADQFDEGAMANPEVAEWAWQAHIAKHNSDLSFLRWSILNTEQHVLDVLLQQLISARHGWCCLANAAAVDAHWQC